MDVRAYPHSDYEELRSRPLGELMRELANDLSTLVHEELELAKAELSQKAKHAGIAGGMFGAAAMTALITLGSLTAMLIALLALAMPVWVAGLIMTVVWTVVTGVLVMMGQSKLKQATPPVPEQAIESTKEDVEWTKTRMRYARR